MPNSPCNPKMPEMTLFELAITPEANTVNNDYWCVGQTPQYFNTIILQKQYLTIFGLMSKLNQTRHIKTKPTKRFRVDTFKYVIIKTKFTKM